jgi:ABC-type multidrug transport system fused ATPase/permease subunit
MAGAARGTRRKGVVQTVFGTLWNFLVTMAVIFLFVMWIWLLITIFSDIFRRKDIGGFGKFLWILFMLLLPLIGAFFYIITQSGGMAERQAEQVARARRSARLRRAFGCRRTDEAGGSQGRRKPDRCRVPAASRQAGRALSAGLPQGACGGSPAGLFPRPVRA